MITKLRPYVIVLTITVFFTSFYLLCTLLIGNFKSTAVEKADLIREHVLVSQNIIDGLAIFGENYFQQDTTRESSLMPYLHYDSEKNLYHLDTVSGTVLQKKTGNLTGIGPIPKDGPEHKNINLALQYNAFFENYYNKFPDISWLYYTGTSGFMNLFPWTSSKEFHYSDQLKNVEFYRVSTPENNPGRKKVWTPVYPDSAGKGLILTLSAPIYDQDIFMGVVSLDYSNAWLSKEITSRYESYLVDDKLTVLASSRRDLENNKIYQLKTCLPLNDHNLNALVTIQERKVSYLGGYFVFTSGFHDTPWKLVMLVPIWVIIGKSFLYALPLLILCILLPIAMRQIELRRSSALLLAKKNNLLEATMSAIDEGIIVTDQIGNITLMNKTAEAYTGWPSHLAIGQEFPCVFHTIDAITLEKRPDPVLLALRSSDAVYTKNNTVLLSREGVEAYISGAVALIRTENGGISGTVTSFRDITKEYEQEKQIEGFLNLDLDMLCVVDIDGRFHKVNKKFEEVLGYNSKDLMGSQFLSYLHDDDVKITLEALKKFMKGKQPSGFTNRFRCKNGTFKYIEWHTQPRIGRFIYSSARDVTEQILKAEALEDLAGRDQLTGTYNRRHFDAVIDAEMHSADALGQLLSMALIDMDHFKTVNDTWGHPVGDDVLIQTAAVIADTIRDSDILVRFGGEEFLLLMPNTPLEGALVVCEKVREAIEKNVHPKAGRQTASFGIAERQKSESFSDWYQVVDHALYQAKESGRNRVAAADSKRHKRQRLTN